MTQQQSNGDIHEELRAKIRSKMELCKFFAGFFTVFVALSSKDLATSMVSCNFKIQFAAWVTALTGLASVTLAFLAASSFDSLLMPSKLWDRPEMCSVDHLKAEMIKVWRLLYWPSIWLLYVSIIGLFFVISGSVWLLCLGIAIVAIIVVWRAFVTKDQGVFK